MSGTLIIPDELYARLEAEAHLRGLNSIEQLLDQWQAPESAAIRRREVVSEIDQLRERLFAKYGEMPDSVELLREDRAR
jgi:hypothetical protein